MKKELSKEIVKKPLSVANLYFIEINSMPTIEPEDSFEYALNYILKIQIIVFILVPQSILIKLKTYYKWLLTLFAL